MKNYFEFSSKELIDLNQRIDEANEDIAEIENEITQAENKKEAALLRDSKNEFQETAKEIAMLKESKTYNYGKLRKLSEVKKSISGGLIDEALKEVTKAEAEAKNEYATQLGKVKRLRDEHLEAIEELGAFEIQAKRKIVGGFKAFKRQTSTTDVLPIDKYGLQEFGTVIVNNHPFSQGGEKKGLAYSENTYQQKYEQAKK